MTPLNVDILPASHGCPGEPRVRMPVVDAWDGASSEASWEPGA